MVLLTVVLVRVVALSLDPPSYRTNGTAWGDEGFWNYSAAYAAVRGDWPDLPPAVHQMAPLYCLIQREVFEYVGTGVLQARYLSVAAGVATCLLVFSLLKPLGDRAALIGLFIYGTNWWVVAFDRFAIPETTCIAFTTAAILVLVRDRSAMIRIVAATTLTVGAILTKPVAAYLVPLVAILLWRWTRKDLQRRHLVALTLASLAAILIALLFGWVASLRTIARYTAVLQGQLRASEAGSYWGERLAELAAMAWQPRYMGHHVAALLGVGCLVAGSLATPSQYLHHLKRAALGWIAFWWISVPFTYATMQRLVLISVPLTLLGMIGLWERSQGTWSLRRGLGARVGLGAYGLWCVTGCGLWLSSLTGLRLRWVAPLLGVLAVALWLRGIGGWLRVAVGALVLCAGGIPLAQWYRAAKDVIVRSERQALVIGTGDPIVCGYESPNLLLAHPRAARALFSNRIWNPECRARGTLAEYVVIPDPLSCHHSASPYVAAQYSALAEGSGVEVVLPAFLGEANPGACRYRIVSVVGTEDD